MDIERYNETFKFQKHSEELCEHCRHSEVRFSDTGSLVCAINLRHEPYPVEPTSTCVLWKRR